MANQNDADVVIIGAGVAGLVAAATLHRAGRRVLVLEKRANHHEAAQGADLAIWPGAATLMRALGVPAAFFSDECFALHTVLMCDMSFGKSMRKPYTATTLTTVDMQAVTNGTGESFALVPRDAMMMRLRALVPDELIQYNATVTNVHLDGGLTYSLDYGTDSAKSHSIRANVVIACDGARSSTRRIVDPEAKNPEFAGETVYRGVLRAQDLNEIVRKILPDEPESRTMRICYGAGLRSSFGYMRSDGDAAYWWVKQPGKVSENDDSVALYWPIPLQKLRNATPQHLRYTHRVEVAETSTHWYRDRIVLAGDAAHLVTPNMGQGACLAAEDAFVLATLLAENPENYQDAFEKYQSIRRPFAEACAKEAALQLTIGQVAFKPLVWLRNLALRNVPPSVLVNKLKANNFDVQPYVARLRMLEAVAKRK